MAADAAPGERRRRSRRTLVQLLAGHPGEDSLRNRVLHLR